MAPSEGSGKKPAAKKRLTRGTPTEDEVMKPIATAPGSSGEDEDHGVKRGTGKKKRQVIQESDEEDFGQPDVENRNVPNIASASNATAKNKKGKRRVVKTRTYFDEKGYMVNEDYSSYEEGEAPQTLPPISQMVKKEPIKRVVQHNLTKEAGAGSKQTAAQGKSQSSLSAFFKK